jgi:segregation and condensation protein A
MDPNALAPIPIHAGATVAVPVGDGEFELRLEIFEGPLALLLHLIESRQLDVLTVPLAEVADSYVAHLARHPVDATNLAEFVAVAAQLIYLKSRRLLPAEPLPPIPDGSDEPDEDELRRRLIEYRTMRNAANVLGERDGTAPAMRREPREADLPETPTEPISAVLLASALDRLAEIPEPAAPPPAVVPREITIGQQIAVLRTALSRSGKVVLQAILATCRTRTEAAVTFLATLELVRRREVSAEQSAIFGPITLDTMPEAER